MIAIPLTKDILESITAANNHPVLSSIISKFRFDQEFLYIPKERFDEKQLQTFIENGDVKIVAYSED